MPLWLVGEHHGTDVRFEVGTGEVGAGRGSDNALVLPSQTASRNHARLWADQDVVHIQDLGSLNGTRVNGQPVQGSTTAHPGDTVEFGSVLLRVADDPDHVTATTPQLSDDKDVSQNIVLSRDDLSDSHVGAAGSPAALRLLTEAGQLLVLPESPDATYDRLLELVERTIPADRILILVNEGDGSDPVQRAARVHGDRAITRLMLSRTMVRMVLDEGGAVLTSDAKADERFMKAQSIVAQDLHSAMAVPLIHHNDTLGLLYVDTSNPTIRYEERDLRVLTLLGQMLGAKVANARLLDIAREQERMEEELRTAARIQKRLLPQRLPELDGYEVVGKQDTCEAVGGDLYDAGVTERTMQFLLGDVSGKGIGAALLMSDVLATLRAMRPFRVPVDDTVARLDRHVFSTTQAEHYLTLFLAELDLEKHELSYVNAGHPAAYLLLADGSIVELESTGMPVGLVDLPGNTFPSVTRPFPPGATLVIYSDGVSEAERGSEQFGDARFAAMLRDCHGLPAEAVIERIETEVRLYVGDAPPGDDLTLFVVRRTGAA
ncbi:SpoIIE family protein phosphatase [bacterium]|nr:SpoIIE family protein phosphatase [bacterium]